VSIGYAAGDAIGAIYRNVNRYALYVLLALAVLLAAYIIRRVARRRRRRAASAEASETEQTPVADEDSAAQEAPATQEDFGTKEDPMVGDALEIRGFHGAKEDSIDNEVRAVFEAEDNPEIEGYSEVEEHFEAEGDNETVEDPVTRESP